jgi:hypothetical protein
MARSDNEIGEDPVELFLYGSATIKDLFKHSTKEEVSPTLDEPGI